MGREAIPIVRIIAAQRDSNPLGGPNPSVAGLVHACVRRKFYNFRYGC